MTQVSIDNVFVYFTCLHCGKEVRVSISSIIEAGTPFCSDCEEDMDPSSMAEIDE